MRQARAELRCRGGGFQRIVEVDVHWRILGSELAQFLGHSQVSNSIRADEYFKCVQVVGEVLDARRHGTDPVPRCDSLGSRVNDG